MYKLWSVFDQISDVEENFNLLSYFNLVIDFISLFSIKLKRLTIFIAFLWVSTMKVLQTSQKLFAALGFTSKLSTQKYRMNIKLLMGSLWIAAALILCILYLVFVDKTFEKYIESVCTIMAIFVIAICFITMVFEINILIECIDDIENLIETSE